MSSQYERLIDLLFSFEGRVNRGRYWLAYLVWVLGAIIAVGLVFALTSWATFMIMLGILIVLLISGIAVGIKRLHDRDKSGWWLLLFYLAPAGLETLGNHISSIGWALWTLGFAISVWAIVELGCRPGTPGPNQYGPNPLDDAVAQPA